MKIKLAVQKINKNHVLLVFPIKNQKEPNSLWREFYPRSKMKWEWDADSDGRVSDLWQLMKKLSDSSLVVYSKWYKGRATFFSRELFTALLCLSKTTFETTNPNAKMILDALENNSPLSTKELKIETNLKGKDFERDYLRALKDLFNSFQIVAYGEVDDGAFPSLAVGATRVLFEDLWIKAQTMKKTQAEALINQSMPVGSEFRKFYDRQLKHAK
jgi:hypothetical protein